MSHNATHRRNLSAPAPKTPMDLTPLNHHPHPSTTVQDISTHFSRLYLNHKAHSFSKPSSTHTLPPIAIHLQDESTAVSTVSHGSTAVFLTRSQSQRSSGAKNRGNPRYIKEEPQEQEESIKKAIVISSREPTRNVNLTADNQENGGGGDEVLKLQGYEVKKQCLSSIGRRRSFGCRSLADFLAFNGVKVVSADMPPFMQVHAVDVTRKTYDSLEKFTAKSLALTLKKEFDGVYGAAWHCIVGLSFGSFVTHSVGGFLYFSMDQKLFVLLFKTAVERAD